MANTTAGSGRATRLILGLVGVTAACLCLGVGGGVAYGLWASRRAAPEPAVEYILDASPRMAASHPEGQESRLSVARAVLAEIVRPADGRVSAGLRVFGNGAQPVVCKDTRLLVPLAPASQARIASELPAVQAGQAADAALAEAMIAAISDLSTTGGPHTLVVVTGGQDSCSPDAGQLIAQEAERAGIKLETFVVGYQVVPEEAQAIRSMVAAAGSGAVYLEAHDKAGLEAVLNAIQLHVDKPETTSVDNVVATAAALPPTATPAAAVTLEEAGDIVEETVVDPPSLDHDVIVFPWPEPLGPDDLLGPFEVPDLGLPSGPIDIPTPSWFFWIDDFPAGKFAHPSRFVLVDIASGAVSVHEAQWWPVLNGESLWARPEDYWNAQNWSFSNFGGRPLGIGGFMQGPGQRGLASEPLLQGHRGTASDPLLQERGTHAEGLAAPRQQGGGRRLALVVNGWRTGETGEAALTLDAAGVRAAFTHAGLETTYLGPSTDPNRDGDYSPEAFAQWAADRAPGLVAGDTLIVYLTGHGDATALAGLSPAAIQAALRAFSANVHVIVILDSSYSGAFIPALSTSADRVITATDANGPALFDEDPAGDPNAATDGGSEFTSGFVEDWEAILNDAQALSDAQQRAVNENRPLWDVLAEWSFHSAVDKDAGAARQRTSPQMAPAQQPTPTPTLTPTTTSTPLPPTATPTPPPTATFTPLPPAPVLDFVVDNPIVPAGKCAVLRWTAVNAASLFLDNQPVPATGRLQVCPTVTTTYTLVANWAGGQVSKQVTVSVATPAAPPPTFGSLDTPTNTWYDAAGCGRIDLPVFAQVDNASSVTIFYRIQPAELPATAWSSLAMSLGSGSVWTRTLTIADMPQANGVMEFYFAASGPGGAAQSPVYTFVTYNDCTPIG